MVSYLKRTSLVALLLVAACGGAGGHDDPPPPPGEKTEQFVSIAELDGVLRKDFPGIGIGGAHKPFLGNGLSANLVGDNSSGQVYSLIYTFDLDTIPSGANIKKARLMVELLNVTTETLAGLDLGEIVIDRMKVGDGVALPRFDAADSHLASLYMFGANSVDNRVTLIPLGDQALGLKQQDVIGHIRASLDEGRRYVQFRIRGTDETDRDGESDFYWFTTGEDVDDPLRTPPTLEITWE